MTLVFLLVFATSVLAVLSEESDRLSKDIVPLDYEVKLRMAPTDNWKRDGILYGSLRGTVCITFEYKTGAGRIKLHGKKKYGMDYEMESEMTLTHLGSEAVGEMKFVIDDVRYDDMNDMFVLPPTDLKPGLYKLCMPFYRVVDNVKSGYYIAEEEAKRFALPHLFHPFTWNRDYSAFFIATNTPRQISFPCFDEPYLKANFKLDLNIEYPFNVKEVKTFTNDNKNKLRITKKENDINVVQDSYMIKGVSPSKVAFVITNLPCHRGNIVINKEVTIKYRYCNRKTSRTKAQTYSRHLLHNPKYHFHTNLMKKTKLIIVPGFGKTASFVPGLNLISDADVLGPDVHFQLFLRLNSQLYGGLIRPASWDDEWILSGLALFCSYRQLKHDNHKYDVGFSMTELPTENSEFLLKESTDIFQQDKPHTKKGLMLMHMLHSKMGDDIFEGFLEQFNEKYTTQEVTPSSLWTILDVIYKAGLPLGPTWANIMDGWEKQPGYPLVSVDLSQSMKITMTQKRFYGNYAKKLEQEESKSKGSPKEICWTIPLSYTIIRGLKRQHNLSNRPPNQITEIFWNWLPCDSSEQTIKTRASAEDLVLVNADYRSFLRIKYDHVTQSDIINALTSHIEYFSPIQRAQLIHDAFSIAWSGYQDYDFAFSLINVALVTYKTDLKVWDAMFASIHNLNEMLLPFPETYKLFQTYLKNVLNKMYVTNYDSKNNPFKRIIDVNLETDFPNDGEDDMFIKWACTVAQIRGCVDAAIGVFDTWQDDRKNGRRDTFSTYFSYLGRSSSLVYTITCTAVSTATMDNKEAKKRFWFLEDSMKGAAYYSYRDWREEYVEALRCVRDPRVVDSTYEWIAEEENYRHINNEKHKGKAFLLLSENPLTHPQALQFFYDKFKVLAHRHRSKKEYLVNFVRTLTSKMDETQKTKMSNFINSRPELNNADVLDAFKEGWTVAKARQQWLKTNQAKIRNILSKIK